MMETNLGEGEEKVPEIEPVYDAKLGNCRCKELEERNRKVEARCLELEFEVKQRKIENEALQTKFRTLEAAKLALEDELKALLSRNKEVGDLTSHIDNEEALGCEGKGIMKGIVDLTDENDEEDKVFQLMAENRVLECEKSKAEKEAEVWKQKFKEMESLTLQLQKSLVLKCVEQPFDGKASDANCSKAACENKTSEAGNIQPAGTPLHDTHYEHFTTDKGDYGVQSSKRVKRHLTFQEARSPGKQIAPSTPAGIKPSSVGIIDIYDSDNEPESAHDQLLTRSKQQKGYGDLLTNHELEGTVGGENEAGMVGDQNRDENVDSCVDNVSFGSVLKRKRASNIVTSDTESDDDDNIPIGKLRRMCCEKEVRDQTTINSKGCPVAATPPAIDSVRGSSTPPKRRLLSLRQAEGKVKNCSTRKTRESQSCKKIPKAEDVEDNDSEENGPDSSSDSMSGFIVDDSDVSDGENGSSELHDNSDCNDADSEQGVSSGSNACDGSTDVSDDEDDFNVVLSRLKRNKDRKSDWKYEADLLAAFGKDLELCMKAVCALYRQQTSGEKVSKATFCQNQRGFSKFDAYRGCTLGEFLTDGDPQGDLKKTVKELQAYDPNAAELCRNLATHYSKQLFEIYNNKEDPYFRPS